MTGAQAAGGSRRRRLAGLAAAVAALAFLAWTLANGWSAVRAHDWNPDPALLGAAAVTLAVFYVASGLGYVAIVESLAPAACGRVRLLAIWAVSLLGRYVPGSVVMVAGRMELSRERGVARRVTAAALVYEQALSVGVAAAAGALFVARHGAIGPRWVTPVVLVVPLGLLLLHPRVMRPATSGVLRRLGREPLAALVPGRRVALLAGWYAATAVLLGLGVWLFVRGLGGPAVGTASFVGGAFLLAFAVSMLAVIVPSGLGIRDGAFALALAQHVPGGVAVALSVGSRLALTLVEVAVVGLTALAARRV